MQTLIDVVKYLVENAVHPVDQDKDDALALLDTLAGDGVSPDTDTDDAGME